MLCATSIYIPPLYNAGKAITISEGAKNITTLSLSHFLTAKFWQLKIHLHEHHLKIPHSERKRKHQIQLYMALLGLSFSFRELHETVTFCTQLHSGFIERIIRWQKSSLSLWLIKAVLTSHDIPLASGLVPTYRFVFFLLFILTLFPSQVNLGLPIIQFLLLKVNSFTSSSFNPGFCQEEFKHDSQVNHYYDCFFACRQCRSATGRDKEHQAKSKTVFKECKCM